MTTRNTPEELYRYIHTDEATRNVYLLPALTKLESWREAGSYTEDRALAYLHRYVVLPASRDWKLKHGSMSDSVEGLFPRPVRMTIAEQISKEAFDRWFKLEQFVSPQPPEPLERFAEFTVRTVCPCCGEDVWGKPWDGVGFVEVTPCRHREEVNKWMIDTIRRAESERILAELDDK